MVLRLLYLSFFVEGPLREGWDEVRNTGTEGREVLGGQESVTTPKTFE